MDKQIMYSFLIFLIFVIFINRYLVVMEIADWVPRVVAVAGGGVEAHKVMPRQEAVLELTSVVLFGRRVIGARCHHASHQRHQPS